MERMVAQAATAAFAAVALRRANALSAERMAIALVLLASAIPYLAHLGFYLDDWIFRAQLAGARSGSLRDAVGALAGAPNVAVRPLQVALLLAYHALAPDSAVFAHLFNHLMLLGAALLVHHGLRMVAPLSRLALPLALMLVSAPWFSTARMWIANHQATLSLLCFALALCVTARIWQRRSTGTARTRDLALLAMAALGTLLSYELLAPVQLGLAVFVWTAGGARWRDLLRDRAFLLAQAVLAGTFVAAVGFKMAVGGGLIDPLTPGNLFHHGALIAMTASLDLLWHMGIAAPWTALRALIGPFGGPTVLLAAMLTAFVLRLLAMASPAQPAASTRDRAGRDISDPTCSPAFLAISGTIAFALGYVAFLPHMVYGADPFGIDNRSHIGGAIGAALILLAGAQALDRRRPGARDVLGGIFCVCGVILNGAIGTSWAQADERAEAIVADIATALPRMRPGDTILVQGECPYLGAGPVWPSSYGLADRLRVQYGVADLRADSVTPFTEVTAQGISISEFGEPVLYPYGHLYLLDRPHGTLVQLATRTQASAWFATHAPWRTTPCRYSEGGGTTLFHEQ